MNRPGVSTYAETILVCWLIAATTLIRLGFGWALGLGVDESYMVAAGRTLRLGYFDHPPAAWWMQWAAAHLLGTEAPIAVRLPFILAFALSTWLMYRLGTASMGPRAGLWAAVTLNLSPVFGVTTGTWVLPDGPLDCALLGAALCLVHALALPAPLSPGAEPDDPSPPERGQLAAWAWWAGAGFCAGLALFSKYSAVLTIGGALLYLLSTPVHRRWLLRPQPYVGGAIALLVFLPVLAWNATHGWASFAFQGERAAGIGFHPLQPIVVLAGEALFVLPWIWLPMMAAFVVMVRRGPMEWRGWLLCCLGAPPIVAFALIAVWSGQRVMFHWAAPGYLMLFPLLGAAIAERMDKRWVRGALLGTAVLVCGAVVVVSTEIRLGWLHPLITRLARHDPELEAIDWTSLRAQLDARALLQPGTVVGVPNWRDAGKIAYALGPGVTVTVLNADARQFGMVAPEAAFVGRDILVLAVDHPRRVRRELAPKFDAVEVLASASIEVRGTALQRVEAWLGLRLRPTPPG
ncbi:MAG TPA: glycosyltransferase family 39 protein [Acetobacteraceae bacterium]|nr:glycosyltransferase family 39 protein [Acetobacteraceae bacterium]